MLAALRLALELGRALESTLGGLGSLVGLGGPWLRMVVELSSRLAFRDLIEKR